MGAPLPMGQLPAESEPNYWVGSMARGAMNALRGIPGMFGMQQQDGMQQGGMQLPFVMQQGGMQQGGMQQGGMQLPFGMQQGGMQQGGMQQGGMQLPGGMSGGMQQPMGGMQQGG